MLARGRRSGQLCDSPIKGARNAHGSWERWLGQFFTPGIRMGAVAPGSVLWARRRIQWANGSSVNAVLTCGDTNLTLELGPKCSGWFPPAQWPATPAKDPMADEGGEMDALEADGFGDIAGDKASGADGAASGEAAGGPPALDGAASAPPPAGTSATGGTPQAGGGDPKPVTIGGRLRS